jgi:hypothetical protein
MPFGKRNLCRRIVELASTKTDTAPEKIMAAFVARLFRGEGLLANCEKNPRV